MLNVLLVEDDAVDAEAITRVLRKCRLNGDEELGASITHVEYFGKAMEVLDTTVPVDIVLLDLHLPDGAGPELVQRLHEKHRHVPVVVLTGLDAAVTLGVDLMRQGAQDYLPKDQVNAVSLTRSIQYSIERHHLSSHIQAQTRELTSRNEELETFTYIASHDLRSPLVNLKGFASELRRSIDTVLPMLSAVSGLDDRNQATLKQELEQDIPEALRFIETSVDKMDRLTQAILQLSRLGRKELTFEKVDTTNLVRQCLDALAHQIRETKTVVTVGTLPSIIGDRISIEQVFGNLLDNAVKYLDSGRAGNIEISSTADRTHTTFIIKDNGRGIAADDLHKVFEIFRRAGKNIEQIPGEGMGMAYVRAILKRHGGDIRCESTLGSGSTFYFTVANHLAPGLAMAA